MRLELIRIAPPAHPLDGAWDTANDPKQWRVELYYAGQV
jgi:hypothetical protein